jgi:threonine dehydratase
MAMVLPTADAVEAAASILAGAVHATPLVPLPSLSERLGVPVWLKAENLQRTGSFKFRGAYHRIARLSAAERARGVITYSSGNHAQAVALAGRLLGAPATVVMPEDAVATKVERARAFGARVLFAGTTSEERRAEAERIARAEGLTVVPPYDDPDIVAGQGTIGLEIAADLPDVSCVLAPVGGGGLLSGIALYLRARRPHVAVFGVEPEGAADAAASLARGELVRLDRPRTVADGLRTSSLGALNFEIVRRHVAGIVTVPDEAILDAMRLVLLEAKLVVEPSGAAAVAALATGAVHPCGPTVAVLSGGNADPARLASVLAR